MKEASLNHPSSTDRIRSWARTKAYGPSPLAIGSRRSSTLPDDSSPSRTNTSASPAANATAARNGNSSPSNHIGANGQPSKTNANGEPDTVSGVEPPAAPPPQDEGEGAVIKEKEKKPVMTRFALTIRDIVLSSWINVLLVFVPVGIAVNFAPVDPTVVFAMNAIAIIPLAGLLSHATESVAKRMGDTIGALMNVTFGNAVELIIFIALVKNEIRIVQASLLGSILANLLLILGMCFLIGGLRFREQIYNSTVTQMSACLLSLSVMSLLLPTAFHASFTDTTKADSAVLKVSRGTSVILLLVYLMYLLFQLKSHAYMYESTPQHIIDEESAPGPVAAWMDSSSSDSDTSSSSDSDSSSGSNRTAKRFKKVMRHARRRRKSSSASKETVESHPLRTPSFTTAGPPTPNRLDSVDDEPHMLGHRLGAIDDTDAAHNVISESSSTNHMEHVKPKKEKKHKKKHHKHKKSETVDDAIEEKVEDPSEPRRVDFAVAGDLESQPIGNESKKFNLRGLRPTIPKTLSQNVFTQPAGSPVLGPQASAGPIPRVRYGIRRTNSLPDRLNQPISNTLIPRASIPVDATIPRPISNEEEEENISRTTAVLLLLASTALVAICAEFMVDSINDVVANTPLGETFVGLIILPIVGNAAEHVTSVSVAAKNKMDLAIGVAVGSSIQIALFVTPLVVLLGWMMNKAMTLYFTLFETVSLFVSAFIVNFLVLDGRSNYLEGSLLCAAYVIIGVASFFYPTEDDQSVLGGATNTTTDTVTMMTRALFKL